MLLWEEFKVEMPKVVVLLFEGEPELLQALSPNVQFVPPLVLH